MQTPNYDSDDSIEETDSEDEGIEEPVIPVAHPMHNASYDGTEPIYAGSSITVAMSMVLIMTFVMRHRLTGTALADLLSLVEIHRLVPNLCKTGMVK